MKPMIILTGPTAAGKTSLSIRLAKEINGSSDICGFYAGV